MPEGTDPHLAHFLAMEREQEERERQLHAAGEDSDGEGQGGNEAEHLTAEEIQTKEDERKRRQIFRALFQSSDLAFFVQFFYYEERRRKAHFALRREELGMNSAILEHMIKIMGHRHSLLGPYEGGDVLMLIHYMEIAQKEPFSPDAIADVLRHSMVETRLVELTAWMQATGKCIDKFGEPQEEEVCLAEHRMKR